VRGRTRRLSVDVLADPAFGCPWRFTEHVSWLTAGPGAERRGDGAILLEAQPNGTGSVRSTRITAAGETITISQLAH
jgi:hypothetical protein